MERIKAIILGHAIADAMGVPVEFMRRASLAKDPVTGYLGYGSHPVPPGTWSDDTSMTLAALDSLSYGLDYQDMMECFCRWEDSAAYTATGVCFDIGITTHRALKSYRQGQDLWDCGLKGEYDNGNGSLMRIIPAVLYGKYKMKDATLEEKLDVIYEVSALTHGHPRSKLACGIYAFILTALLDSQSKEGVQTGLTAAKAHYETQFEYQKELAHYSRIFCPDFADIPEEEIKSSGYVVDTLEAALWCLLNTESYFDCVLKAVNLGDDTDTVAAVAGGLAASIYGIEGIPEAWINGLLKKEGLLAVCEQFAKA